MNPLWWRTFPGLIQGAHQGAGLGIQFLKHIERTRILVHLIDASGIDPEEPLKGYHTIQNELTCYNDTLASKPQLVVLNKLDLPETKPLADAFHSALANEDVLDISAQTGDGVTALISSLVQLLEVHHGN